MSSDKDYMRVYVDKRYYQRKQAAIAQLGGKCVRCGSIENLQFDHVDPQTKSFVIARKLAGVSEKRLQEELLKCQLLCRSCHDLKTPGDVGKKVAKGTHGTSSSYRYCRCDLRRAANAARSREYKAKKRLRS